jgi:SAM-dependent methyltransferase
VRARAAEELVVLKALLAGDQAKPDLLRLFAHADDQSWLSLNTLGYRRRAPIRRLLPSMPDPELQIRYVGSAGDASLREGWLAYQFLRELTARWGRPIGPSSNVLDFGCGWGRILRFFLRDVPAEQLWGADVLPLSIEVCKETNPHCTFMKVNPFPPTELPSDKFDLIYLYSVFSHLSEESHQAWLSEFHRILRPGGMVIATTWHRGYIEACDRARRGDVRGSTHPGSVLAFKGDTAEWLARFDRGEFVHSPIGGGAGLDTDFYGETCIPEAYVRNRWSDRFQIREYLEPDFKQRFQSVIAVQKR